MSLASRSKGSRIAQFVETSNAESPTPMNIYQIHDSDDSFNRKCQRGECINIPRGVPIALFLTNCSNLRDSYSVKTKASRKRLCLYVAPSNRATIIDESSSAWN